MQRGIIGISITRLLQGMLRLIRIIVGSLENGRRSQTPLSREGPSTRFPFNRAYKRRGEMDINIRLDIVKDGNRKNWANKNIR